MLFQVLLISPIWGVHSRSPWLCAGHAILGRLGDPPCDSVQDIVTDSPPASSRQQVRPPILIPGIVSSGESDSVPGFVILFHTTKPCSDMISRGRWCRMFTAVNARAAAEAEGHTSTEAQEKELTDLYLKALGHIKTQDHQAAQVQEDSI